jgi:hypothetical protein
MWRLSDSDAIMMMIRLTLALCPFANLLCACASPNGHQTPDSIVAAVSEMKHDLEAAIPVGTPANVAEARLREGGFTVGIERNFPVIENHLHQQVDFAYGDRAEGGIVKRRWQVTAFLNADRVSELDVNTYLEGP